MELSEKVALVTGAAHRVGKAIALALAAEGSHLVLHYRSSASEAEDTAEAARELGVRVLMHRADLSEPAAADAMLAAGAGLGPVQLLVNSAAFFPSDTLSEVTPDQLDRTLRVNLFGPVFVTQSFARALPADLSGAVVNVTDWKTARPYQGPRFSYTLSKGAVDTLTLVAAGELAPRIRVNAVALGVILPPPDKDDAYAERLAAELPLQRVGGVEVVARAVLHLLANDFITGETIRLDGGAHLR